MPRVKLIYVGNGEYVKPSAKFGECDHPRDQLRFDSRFFAPIYVYCCACGQPYLHPFHGLTEEEIKAAKERGEKLWAGLQENSSQSSTAE